LEANQWLSWVSLVDFTNDTDGVMNRPCRQHGVQCNIVSVAAGNGETISPPLDGSVHAAMNVHVQIVNLSTPIDVCIDHGVKHVAVSFVFCLNVSFAGVIKTLCFRVSVFLLVELFLVEEDLDFYDGNEAQVNN
ncbi:hypothetical protein Tco_0057511, partial [Tanacetum coccineum]